MNEKVKKVLMYVFFPITLILIGFKIFMEFNKSNADKSLDKANEKDRKLELEEQALKQEAKVHEAKAAEIEKEIKEETNTDLDWHKKV